MAKKKKKKLKLKLELKKMQEKKNGARWPFTGRFCSPEPSSGARKVHFFLLQICVLVGRPLVALT